MVNRDSLKHGTDQLHSLVFEARLCTRRIDVVLAFDV
jgi:hypothetical protein